MKIEVWWAGERWGTIESKEDSSFVYDGEKVQDLKDITRNTSKIYEVHGDDILKQIIKCNSSYLWVREVKE